MREPDMGRLPATADDQVTAPLTRTRPIPAMGPAPVMAGAGSARRPLTSTASAIAAGLVTAIGGSCPAGCARATRPTTRGPRHGSHGEAMAGGLPVRACPPIRRHSDRQRTRPGTDVPGIVTATAGSPRDGLRRETATRVPGMRDMSPAACSGATTAGCGLPTVPAMRSLAASARGRIRMLASRGALGARIKPTRHPDSFRGPAPRPVLRGKSLRRPRCRRGRQQAPSLTPASRPKRPWRPIVVRRAD
jgi:hypothetical protein